MFTSHADNLSHVQVRLEYQQSTAESRHTIQFIDSLCTMPIVNLPDILNVALFRR